MNLTSDSKKLMTRFFYCLINFALVIYVSMTLSLGIFISKKSWVDFFSLFWTLIQDFRNFITSFFCIIQVGGISDVVLKYLLGKVYLENGNHVKKFDRFASLIQELNQVPDTQLKKDLSQIKRSFHYQHIV